MQLVCTLLTNRRVCYEVKQWSFMFYLVIYLDFVTNVSQITIIEV